MGLCVCHLLVLLLNIIKTFSTHLSVFKYYLIRYEVAKNMFDDVSHL